jgi:hypothetical protein
MVDGSMMTTIIYSNSRVDDVLGNRRREPCKANQLRIVEKIRRQCAESNATEARLDSEME